MRLHSGLHEQIRLKLSTDWPPGPGSEDLANPGTAITVICNPGIISKFYCVRKCKHYTLERFTFILILLEVYLSNIDCCAALFFSRWRYFFFLPMWVVGTAEISRSP